MNRLRLRRPASRHGREDGPPAGSGRVGQTPRTPDRPTDRPACVSMLVLQHRETNIVVLQHLFVNVCCS